MATLFVHRFAYVDVCTGATDFPHQYEVCRITYLLIINATDNYFCILLLPKIEIVKFIMLQFFISYCLLHCDRIFDS